MGDGTTVTINRKCTLILNQLITYTLYLNWQWQAIILCILAFVDKVGRVVFYITMTVVAIVWTLLVFAAIALGFYGWNFLQEGRGWWEGAACAGVALICLMLAGTGRSRSKARSKPSNHSHNQLRNSGSKDGKDREQDRYGNADDKDRRLEPDYSNYRE